jgi:hypothetical protein
VRREICVELRPFLSVFICVHLWLIILVAAKGRTGFCCRAPLKTSLLLFGVPPFVQKLGTRDNRFDEFRKTIAVGGLACTHILQRCLVRKQERSAQSIRQQLATQIIDKFGLTFL